MLDRGCLVRAAEEGQRSGCPLRWRRCAPTSSRPKVDVGSGRTGSEMPCWPPFTGPECRDANEYCIAGQSRSLCTGLNSTKLRVRAGPSSIGPRGKPVIGLRGHTTEGAWPNCSRFGSLDKHPANSFTMCSLHHPSLRSRACPLHPQRPCSSLLQH